MKRKTIGVLVGGITDDFTRLLCHGVIERAKTLDTPQSPSRKKRFRSCFIVDDLLSLFESVHRLR